MLVNGFLVPQPDVAMLPLPLTSQFSFFKTAIDVLSQWSLVPSIQPNLQELAVITVTTVWLFAGDVCDFTNIVVKTQKFLWWFVCR